MLVLRYYLIMFRGIYSILAMKHLASFASLGGLKNDAVFDSWGDIMLGLYNDIGLYGVSISRLLKFFLLAEV